MSDSTTLNPRSSGENCLKVLDVIKFFYKLIKREVGDCGWVALYIIKKELVLKKLQDTTPSFKAAISDQNEALNHVLKQLRSSTAFLY